MIRALRTGTSLALVGLAVLYLIVLAGLAVWGIFALIVTVMNGLASYLN